MDTPYTLFYYNQQQRVPELTQSFPKIRQIFVKDANKSAAIPSRNIRIESNMYEAENVMAKPITPITNKSMTV